MVGVGIIVIESQGDKKLKRMICVVQCKRLVKQKSVCCDCCDCGEVAGCSCIGDGSDDRRPRTQLQSAARWELCQDSLRSDMVCVYNAIYIDIYIYTQ